jgi:hypothetical protein
VTIKYETSGGALSLSGSAGNALEVGEPDIDNEVEFGINVASSCCCSHDGVAYLGPDERRALIDWLLKFEPAPAHVHRASCDGTIGEHLCGFP